MAGQKVLLLDAARLPSDHPISTHFVSPCGVDWLDELGAGERVRAMAPPSHGVRLEMLRASLDVSFPRGRSGRCLRRLRLDPVLQECAVRAGADLRDRTKVVGLLREGDRVVGVQTVHGDVRSEYRARMVVGADGRTSQVAELAGAKEYLGYDNSRFAYWAYWPRKAWDGEQQRLGSYLCFHGDRTLRFVFQTDDDLLLVAAGPQLTELPAWKGRFEEAYMEALRGSPVTAAIVEGNRRATDLVGVLKLRFFFREAAGPGFALVGDAGLHKDPTPGYGITDALRDARNLAPAILDGSDAALVRYWRQRDVDSIELFSFARYMGDPVYVNTLNEQVYKLAARRPDILCRLAAQADREMSPFEVIAPGDAIGAMLRGVFTGNFSAWPSFLLAAKTGAGVRRAKQESLAALAAVGPMAPG
jgi:flavin-dependent dehydrogenase